MTVEDVASGVAEVAAVAEAASGVVAAVAAVDTTVVLPKTTMASLRRRTSRFRDHAETTEAAKATKDVVVAVENTEAEEKTAVAAEVSALRQQAQPSQWNSNNNRRLSRRRSNE